MKVNNKEQKMFKSKANRNCLFELKYFLSFHFLNYVRFFTLAFFFLSCYGFSQAPKKEYIAQRIVVPPQIDGFLNDSCWLNAPVAGNFIQSSPNPGMPSRMSTEVKVVYDDFAIYFSARMFDTAPDSILKELSKRDNVFFGPNADAFGLLIDAYRDGRNALFFGVTAAGVQADTKISGDEDFDDSWTTVWDSKVNIDSLGWTVEIKIPYSALRFSQTETQEWAVNFARQIRRYNEFSNWNPVNPNEKGFIHQAGILKGIHHIRAPLRLSFSPYISGYADNYAGKNSYLFNAGADIKYGISESFTLDMTLIPDFGQVRSDDQVLNLSPFEVFYDEQRPFFTEGTEIFRKGNLFYSRRVGGTPLYFDAVYDSLRANEKVTENPSSVQLYNATKISGRTKRKTGIGFFNAVTAPAFATLKDTLSGNTRSVLTQPLTNYNVVVLDQGLKNNSFVSLLNTNVMRAGSVYDANVSGANFQLNNRQLSYFVHGNFAYSHKFFSVNGNAGSSASADAGHRAVMKFGKSKGNFTFDAGYFEKSDEFDPNDLGFLERNNDAGFWTDYQYNIYKPFWLLNTFKSELEVKYNMRYSPRSYSMFEAGVNFSATFQNFHTLSAGYYIQPFENFDYYEPRTEGRYYAYASNSSSGINFISDARKRFSFAANLSQRIFNERNRHVFSWQAAPRFRFSNRFNLSYFFFSEVRTDDVGFADWVNDTIIFGVRDMNTLTHTLDGNYIFSATMSLSLRARHYWSQVKYREYFALNNEGKAEATTYSANNDINFNAFTVDMVFTWQFLPGSEMSIVWKNAISTSGQELVEQYLDNLSRTLSAEQLNSFSIKILYYLDYLSLKRKGFNGRMIYG